jgi:hypothetical protein
VWLTLSYYHNADYSKLWKRMPGPVSCLLKQGSLHHYHIAECKQGSKRNKVIIMYCLLHENILIPAFLLFHIHITNF